MHAKTFLALSLLLAAAAPLGAQAVAGDAVDPQTGERISSAQVSLLDAAGAERASTLTDAAGRYALRAGAPGAYRLRLERVGYTSATSPVLRLEAGQTLQYRFAATQTRVQLQGIVATARSRCAPRAQGGAEVATLWEEARKALRGTRSTEENRQYRYLVKRFARSIRPGSRTVLSDSAETSSAVLPKPFVSVPAYRMENGWVQAEGNSTVYFAPDAEVLTSGFFMRDRCFRIVGGGEGEARDWVGLAFEPTRDRRVPDIEGILWLDSATAELRRLEYRYTGLNIRGGSVVRQIGGELDFHRLPDGAWIVRRWRIRLPQYDDDRPASAVETLPVITALREEGGDVTEIRTTRGEPLRLESLAQLAGVVYDSTQGRPLPGARVALRGTAHSAVTDSLGYFVLRDLTEGAYEVALAHPRLDTLEYDFAPARVALRNGFTARRDFAVPSFATLLTAGCPAAAGSAALAGTVRTTEGSALPASAVTVAWNAAAGADSARVSADEMGRFRFCAVPAGVPLRLRTAAQGAIGVTEVVLGAGTRGYQELALDLPRGAAQVATLAPEAASMVEARVVTGTLLDGRSGRPVAAATVRMGSLSAVTGRDGTFEIEGVAPGHHSLEVRHASYPDRSVLVEVLNAPATDLDLRISPDDAPRNAAERAEEDRSMSSEGPPPGRVESAPAGSAANAQRPGGAVALAPLVATSRPLARVPSRAFRTLGSRRTIIEREQIVPRLQAVRTFGDLGRTLAGVNVVEDARGTRFLSRGKRVIVFLDGVRADDIIVRNIQPASVESMEFIPNGDARYASGPVLLVWTLTGERGSRRDVLEKQ